MRLPRTVYAIQHNVTKRTYVGSSCRAEKRILSHLWSLRRGDHHVEDMQADFYEYGEDYTFFKLGSFKTIRESDLEYAWMVIFQSHIRGKGYNYKDKSTKQIFEKGEEMKGPRGIDLMRTLIELLAEQEGVNIHYVIEQDGEEVSGSTERNHK